MYKRLDTKKWNIAVFAGLFLIQGDILLSQESPSVAMVENSSGQAPKQKQSGASLSGNIKEKANSRQRLALFGIEYESGYTAEYFGKLRGGINSRTGGEYLGSIEASFNLDLSQARIGRGHFVLRAQNLHGRGINESRVGAIQNPSSLDESAFTKLTEMWYSDEYFQGKLKTKLGRQYADSDFAVIENGSEFINSSYGLIPTNPMPTYPLPSYGASIWATPRPWVSFGAGIFRGGRLNHPDSALPSVQKGSYTLLEMKIEPISHKFSQSGIFRFGVWQQAQGTWLTSSEDRIAPRLVRNYGLYGAADYWFRKPQGEEDSGPGVFFQWGWTPTDRNEVSSYLGGGISYKGIISRRSKDVVGFGLTRARCANSMHETAIEFFYKWQASSRVTIQPDLQWLLRPSGTVPHTLLLGLRFGYQFQ